MTKNVLVSISGLHTAAEGTVNQDDHQVDVLNAGTYYFKNGKHYVLLEEVAEGIPGVTKTQIKWKDTELLEVTKKGISNTHMVFEPNKRNPCTYGTPFGTLTLGICTKRLLTNVNEEQIEIQAEYILDADGTPMTESTIMIIIKPQT